MIVVTMMKTSTPYALNHAKGSYLWCDVSLGESRATSSDHNICKEASTEVSNESIHRLATFCEMQYNSPITVH